MQLWLANHIFPAFQQGLSKIISNKGLNYHFKQRLNKSFQTKVLDKIISMLKGLNWMQTLHQDLSQFEIF